MRADQVQIGQNIRHPNGRIYNVRNARPGLSQNIWFALRPPDDEEYSWDAWGPDEDFEVEVI